MILILKIQQYLKTGNPLLPSLIKTQSNKTYTVESLSRTERHKLSFTRGKKNIHPGCSTHIHINSHTYRTFYKHTHTQRERESRSIVHVGVSFLLFIHIFGWFHRDTPTLFSWTGRAHTQECVPLSVSGLSEGRNYHLKQLIGWRMVHDGIKWHQRGKTCL